MIAEIGKQPAVKDWLNYEIGIWWNLMQYQKCIIEDLMI